MTEKLQTIIFMVRHGETNSSYSRDKGTDKQRRLTDYGRKQSIAVGRFLDQFSPSVIYSSPLDRCQETAKLIQQEIVPSPPIESSEALVEVYSSEPKVRQEVGERGESIFETILREHRGEQAVAVTHQYIIGYIVAEFLHIEYRNVRCDPADVYRLVFADEKLVEVMRLQPAEKLQN